MLDSDCRTEPREHICAEQLYPAALWNAVWRPEVDASSAGAEHGLRVEGNLFRGPGEGETVEQVVGDQRARPVMFAGADERTHLHDELRLEHDRLIELRNDSEVHGDLASGNPAGAVTVLVDDGDRAEHDPDARVAYPLAHYGHEIWIRAPANLQLPRRFAGEGGEARRPRSDE